MAGLSEPVALAIIAGVVAIITAIIGAARTAAKPPAEPVTGKPLAYVVKLDDDDRDGLTALAATITNLGKEINELRHELMQMRRR